MPGLSRAREAGRYASEEERVRRAARSVGFAKYGWQLLATAVYILSMVSGSQRHDIALIALLLSWLAISGQASADDITGTRPGAGGAADEVSVSLVLLDIVGVDNRAQTFDADLYIEVSWPDPRLAAPGDGANEFRRFTLDEVWLPRLVIINDRGLDGLLPEAVMVDRQGTVVLRQRLAGPLAVDLDLRRFPFDTHRLPIEIVSYQYSPEEVVFSHESLMIAKFDDLSGGGWTFEALDPEFSVFRIRDDGRGSSLLEFAVLAQRDARYYLITLSLPMTLILCLAWLVHWLPPDLIPARMGMASATVFSLIALGISFRLSMPEIAYLTAADRFVLFSTLLLIASLAVAVTATRWVKKERPDAADRLTRQARWVFPVLYVGILLAVAI